MKPGVYARITEVAPAIVEQVAAAMEFSAANPQQQEMVASHLSDLELPDRMRCRDDVRLMRLTAGCGRPSDVEDEFRARSSRERARAVTPAPMLCMAIVVVTRGKEVALECPTRDVAG